MLGGRFGVVSPLENAALDITAPIESALRDATRPAADFVNNLTDINRLTDENQDLRAENERLTVQAARLQEAETELQRLRQLLGIRERRPDDTFVAADVFASDPSNAKELVAIDRGSADGVRKGMIVLTQQGSLVGTVSNVLRDVAWVTLITDPSSAISAVIQDSRVQGVVAGTADGGLTMDFVEETADVHEGDLVLSSGLGGRHPRGEIIGKVVEVDQAARELFQEVHVQPLADLSRLESVLVLSSFLPQDEEGS